jgi:hypothetical protein
MINTFEGNHAYLILLEWWSGALDHFTYYWAYDTGSSSSIKDRMINLRQNRDNIYYNVKGQKSNLKGFWHIKFKY